MADAYYSAQMQEEATRSSVLQAERAIGTGGVRDVRRAEEAAKVTSAVHARAQHLDSYEPPGGLGFGSEDCGQLAQFYSARMQEEATRASVLQAEGAIGTGGVRDVRRAEEATKVTAAIHAKALHLDSYEPPRGLGFGSEDCGQLAEFYASQLAEEATRASVMQADRAIGTGGVRDMRRTEEADKVAAAVLAQGRHL